jgi:hypothetical protein
MYTQTGKVWNQGKIVRNYFRVNINLQPISTTLAVTTHDNCATFLSLTTFTEFAIRNNPSAPFCGSLVRGPGEPAPTLEHPISA